MASQFQGVFPAIVTPADKDGRFDPDAVYRLADFLYSKGVNGCYATGSTGEGLLLRLEDRKEIAKTVVDAFKPRGKVIIHVGTLSTRDSAELAAHAAEIGADAVSSIPPIYFRYSEEDIFEYYRELGHAAGIPLFVYSIPELLNRKFGADDLARYREIPEFAGLKFTDYNLYEMRNIREDFGEDFTIFNGYDQVFTCGLMMGASGGIGSTYNFMPEFFVAIHKAVANGDLQKAFDLQYQLNRVLRIAIRKNSMAATKAILRLRGVNCGEPIRPIRQPEQEWFEELESSLKEVGFPDECMKEAVDYIG